MIETIWFILTGILVFCFGIYTGYSAGLREGFNQAFKRFCEIRDGERGDKR